MSNSKDKKRYLVNITGAVEIEASSNKKAKDAAAKLVSSQDIEFEYRADHLVNTKIVDVHGMKMKDCVGLHHDD